jgi:hypothetical protein
MLNAPAAAAVVPQSPTPAMAAATSGSSSVAKSEAKPEVKAEVRPLTEARREAAKPAAPAQTTTPAAPTSGAPAGVAATVPAETNAKVASLPPAAAKPAPSIAEQQVRAVIARADNWLKAGNVANARALLADAAKGENADVITALAETYDPIALQRYPRLAGQADAKWAQELYAQASAKGSEAARERLKALQAFMQKPR